MRSKQHRSKAWVSSWLLPSRHVRTLTTTLIILAAVAAATYNGASSGAASVGGTLRVSALLTESSGGVITFDPTQALAQGANVPWELPIYDTLLHRNAKTGAFLPGLASKAIIVNPSTIKITLRSGVTFSDGTPFDATAVMLGLLRNKNAPQHGQIDTSVRDIGSISVTGNLALTVNLASPVAGAFYDQLSLPSTYIVSPTAARNEGANLGTSPVGAGPYVLKSYTPNESIVLARNPHYWDAKAIHLSEIEFVNVAVGPQQVNALEAGTVDVTTLASPSEVPAVHKPYTVVKYRSINYPFDVELCKSTSPMDNVDVRKALNYAINRKQILTLFNGTAVPQWSLWAPGSPYSDPSLVNFTSMIRKRLSNF